MLVNRKCLVSRTQPSDTLLGAGSEKGTDKKIKVKGKAVRLISQSEIFNLPESFRHGSLSKTDLELSKMKVSEKTFPDVRGKIIY